LRVLQYMFDEAIPPPLTKNTFSRTLFNCLLFLFSMLGSASAQIILENNAGLRETSNVLAAMKNENSLKYLYDDLDFAYVADAKNCPGLGDLFFAKIQTKFFTCSVISYSDFGFLTHGILVRSESDLRPKKLLIYNHGHGGLPLPTDLWAIELFNNLLSNNWDILFVSMPFTGVDKLTHAVKFKTPDGYTIYDPMVLPEPYGGFHALFEIADTGRSNYMRFFIDSTVVNAIKLESEYAEISFLGLSGGATTGLYSCAVLQDIVRKCILVAGVMPSNLRLTPKTWGDAEQVTSSFHLKNPVMKVIKELSQSNTELTLIYNNRDVCCFDEPSALKFKKMLRSQDLLKVINFQIRDSAIHGYDPSEIYRYLK
jgi:hypothetical protein